MKDMRKEETYYILSNKTNRSLLAASILQKNNASNYIVIEGGFIELKNLNYPKIFVPPKTSDKSNQNKCGCEIFWKILLHISINLIFNRFIYFHWVPQVDKILFTFSLVLRPASMAGYWFKYSFLTLISSDLPFIFLFKESHLVFS